MLGGAEGTGRREGIDGAIVEVRRGANYTRRYWRGTPLLLTVALSPVLALEALLRGVATRQEKAKLAPPKK